MNHNANHMWDLAQLAGRKSRLLEIALKTLDQIAVMPRQARARSVASATANFVRELDRAARQRVNGKDQRELRKEKI